VNHQRVPVAHSREQLPDTAHATELDAEKAVVKKLETRNLELEKALSETDYKLEAAAEKVRADNAKAEAAEAEAALLPAHPARQPNRLPPASEQARSDDAAAAAARVAADEPFDPRNSRVRRRGRMLKGALA
jgi:hypothetical protein